MPPKKKKGKESKLARMSDEERVRYLQHRADVELEAKRRKQQLIAIFTKNKLKREDAFARINTAKINEQWRSTLRQIKCSDLHEDVHNLHSYFETTLKIKDELIKKLFNELVDADTDHRRFQEMHIMALDNIIQSGRKRVNYFTEIYEESVKKIKVQDLEEFRSHKKNMKRVLFHLKSIVFAKHKYLEENLNDIRTKNAVNLYSLEFTKEESMTNFKRQIHPKMENLWLKLNDVITNYESSTLTKREQYEFLKEKDDADQAEITQFPKTYSKLRETSESLRKNLLNIAQERNEIIEDLYQQSEVMTKKVVYLRQQAKINQTMDEVQLKQLSVLSSETIKDLERILEKSTEILKLAKLCSDWETDSFYIKKYESSLETPKTTNVELSSDTASFFNKIEGFRDHLYYIKEENCYMKQERNNLLEENDRLKHSLKSYLLTVSRIPTIRPRTRA